MFVLFISKTTNDFNDNIKSHIKYRKLLIQNPNTKPTV